MDTPSLHTLSDPQTAQDPLQTSENHKTAKLKRRVAGTSYSYLDIT